MRGLLIAVLLLAAVGCGADADPSQLAVDATWDGDTINWQVETDLPDGAVLSWGVFDDLDEEDVDAAYRSDHSEVQDGRASETVDVADFVNNEALVEVDFLPGFVDQPDEASELTPLSDSTTVTR